MNLFTVFITWYNRISNSVSIIDDTVILSKNGITLELRKLSAKNSFAKYGQETSDPISKKMYSEFAWDTVTGFSYDLNLSNFFGKSDGIVICLPYGELKLLYYNLERGFYTTDEERWHICDLTRHKERSAQSWTNEYYLPYFL